MAFVVETEASFATEIFGAFVVSIDAWASKVDKSVALETGWDGFFVEVALALESFPGLAGIVGTGVFAAKVDRAFEASTAAWTIMADRSDPG